MAGQMLASVEGMSACTTPNEASAPTTEASCGVSQQTRTCARTPSHFLNGTRVPLETTDKIGNRTSPI
jgi:hypothetical protein